MSNKKMSPETAAAHGASSLLSGVVTYPKDDQYRTGEVLSYCPLNKKGFVGSKDVQGAIFFHQDDILPKPNSTKIPLLDTGDKVTYLIVPNRFSKGEPHAINIELIPTTPGTIGHDGAAGHEAADTTAAGSKPDKKNVYLSGDMEESETPDSA